MKRAIVTGANGGIGFHTASRLAQNGIAVTLACRDQNRGDDALKRIMQRYPDAKVDVSILNLASLKSVREFSERYKASHESLDILVNNAAVMAVPERKVTEDGNELQFATNHLGHFALSANLLDLLAKGESARVVTVSSIAHKYGKLDFNDLQNENSYEGWAVYGMTKLCNLLFTLELDRKLKSKGIPIVAAASHPGVSKTNILSSGPVMGKKVLRTYLSEIFAQQFAQTDEQGSLPVIHAATNPSVKGGEYFGPDGIFELRGKPTRVTPTTRAQDENTARQLWSASEKLTGTNFLSN